MHLGAAAVVAAALVLLALDYAIDCGYVGRRHSLAGKLVLITGAAGGLGRAVAAEFARHGAVLALWDVRGSALDELREWLELEHGTPAQSIHTRVVDVGDGAAVASAAGEQLRSLGAPHVVVSNAGTVSGDGVLDASEERLRAAFDVNALAHFRLAKHFVRQMLDASRRASGGNARASTRAAARAATDAATQGRASTRQGVFVTMGSLMAELPAARLSHYCAGKAATLQLHECMRCELRSRGDAHAVRCLHVQPYLIDTGLFAGGRPLRFAWMRALLPPLSPSAVARRLVRAVQTRRRERLVIPWALKWLPSLLGALPAPLRDAALALANADHAMSTFAPGARGY